MAGKNPILTSYLVQDDGGLDGFIKQMEALKKVMASNREEAKKLKKELGNYNKETDKGGDGAKKAAAEADRLAKAQKAYKQSLEDVNSEILRLRKETQENNKVQKLNLQLNQSAEGSYNRLAAQYALLKIRLNAMSEEERKATREGKALEKQAKDIYEEMDRLQKATGKYTLSVGDYKQATTEVIAKLSEMQGAAGSAVGGLGKLGSAFTAIAANPVVGTFVLLAAVMTTLFNLFTKTSKGADLMAKAQGYLNGLLSAAVGLMDRFISFAEKAFEDPIGSLEAFGKALLENVVNRLKGSVDVIINVSKAIGNLLTGDLGAAKEAAEDAGYSFAQMLTGLTEEDINKVGGAIKGLTKDINEQAQAFADLAARQREVRRENREREKSVADLAIEEERLKKIVEDDTRSFKEKNDANEKALEILKERSKLEIAIASQNLKLINDEIGLRRANNEEVEDLLDRQLEAYKALRGAELAYTTDVASNTKERRQIKQDELERDLDIVIDGYDFRKTIIERQLKDERLSFEERKALLAQAEQLGVESLEKQIETIQKFTDVQLDSNSILNESNAVVLNEKIRGLGLSEIIEGRLLEVTKERAIAVRDLEEANRDLIKAENQANAKAFENAFAVFESKQKVALSEIDLAKKTEAEKQRIGIEAEIELLQKRLELNKAYGDTLTELQKQQVQDSITVLQNELARIKDGGDEMDMDLYSLIGLKLDPEDEKLLNESLGKAKEKLGEYMQARIGAADVAVQAAERETQAAQTRLDEELALREKGYANNVANAERELALNQENYNKAVKQKEQAERQQRRIATIEQAVNLVTASTKILQQFGVPWGLPILALMWGTFAASKIKAAQVVKSQQFAEGGTELLDGGSHASGNDKYIGTNRGRKMYAEGGEKMSIFNKRAVSKYGKRIDKTVEAMNKLQFDAYGDSFKPSKQLKEIYFNSEVSGFDDNLLRSMDGNLYKLVKQGETTILATPDGKIIRKNGNSITISRAK